MSSSYVPLIETTRGGTPECLHFGAVAVTDTQGRVLAQAGDAQWRTFTRSTLKPFQALPLLQAGGVKRFGLTRSNLACGELITPWGGRVAFIPGAEGLQFSANGTRLWVVSESGARPYEKPSKPFTPAVSSFEWPRLIQAKRTACGFKPS